MKILLLMLFLYPASLLSHDWERIYINPVDDVFYYDKESIKVSDETISVLMLMNYGNPYDDGVISTESDLELNCYQQTAQIKVISLYPERMGKGELMANEAIDIKENVSIGKINGYRILLDMLCGEGGLTANWITSFNQEGVLDRYIDAYSIEENEDGYINYWILTNYYEFDGSIYDLLEINCEESKMSLRTKYRRSFNQFMGKQEIDAYEYITDWIFPEAGSNYMLEIQRICNLVEEY